MEKLRRRAIEFTRFWNPDDLSLGFSDAECLAAADKAVCEITGGKGKICVRLCGQSGSGKSTQLFPAAAAFFGAIGVELVHVAVRNFVKYHPRLGEIRRMFGDEKLRENTNAFALLTLLLALEKLIASGFALLFEMTLLSPEFEKYVSSLLANAGYSVEYHILAVPKSVSDNFIQRRAAANGIEQGRVVLKKSADFFYDVLLPGMDAAAGVITGASAVVWSAFDADPVFVGKIGDEEVRRTIERYRGRIDVANMSEIELLDAKVKWFKNHRAG
ncbi:MAG: zeta toxin family protein [Rickettsiales bacterium]|jgi:hypothetical protein|nr:zeta toxin family protein [Rickettsiales bacterium]